MTAWALLLTPSVIAKVDFRSGMKDLTRQILSSKVSSKSERNYMFTFGSDPEFMLVDEKGNLRSAIKVVEGSPESRIKIKGHEFYYDNVLAECAVRPERGKKKVLESFKECLETYAELVRPYRL